MPSSQTWVTQTVYTQLDDAITRAKESLSDADSSSMLLDYQTYILFLNLDGGAEDIGATFAGFNYTGFVNEVQVGTRAATLV